MSVNEAVGQTVGTSEQCQFLNVPQVARRLGMSASKVRRNIRQGLIPAYDLSWGTGRPTYGVKPADLEQLLAENCHRVEVAK